MKSLSRIFSEQERITGVSKSHIVSENKEIKCGFCGKTAFVPGHIDDYLCVSCQTRVEFNNEKLTSPSWNWARDQTRKRVERDRISKAVPKRPKRIKTIKDDT